MSISVTCTGLGWCTAEGRSLFSHLDISFTKCRTGLVGGKGAGKTTLLRLLAGELPVQKGCISTGGSTIRFLQQPISSTHCATTVADVLGVSESLNLLRRAEAGEADVDDLAQVDWALEARISSALAHVGLDALQDTPLNRLSTGQRTQAGLAAILLAKPDFVLLDEPEISADSETRAAVTRFLADWSGGVIVASRDSVLLDTMDAIIELTPQGTAIRHRGNWTHYRKIRAQSLASARRNLALASNRLVQAKRSARAATERKAIKDACGHRRTARGGVPHIRLQSMTNRSEATRGASVRLAHRRRSNAVASADCARTRLLELVPAPVHLPSTRLPVDSPVLEMKWVKAGYNESAPVLDHCTFSVVGPQRIALIGPDGDWKSSVVDVITGKLAPLDGSVKVHTEFIRIDRQVSLLNPTDSLLDNFLRINPGSADLACSVSLARFKLPADAAVQPVSALSDEQRLCAGLACVLGGKSPPPFLLIEMPDVILDTESAEALVAGLRAYDGALLITSNDEAFLGAIEIQYVLRPWSTTTTVTLREKMSWRQCERQYA